MTLRMCGICKGRAPDLPEDFGWEDSLMLKKRTSYFWRNIGVSIRLRMSERIP